jgi:hypothetical protein
VELEVRDEGLEVSVIFADRSRGAKPLRTRGFRIELNEHVSFSVARYAENGANMSLQVAPEIEASVREEAAARGVSVDAVMG